MADNPYGLEPVFDLRFQRHFQPRQSLVPQVVPVQVDLSQSLSI
jgi:hypothetical protein